MKRYVFEQTDMEKWDPYVVEANSEEEAWKKLKAEEGSTDGYRVSDEDELYDSKGNYAGKDRLHDPDRIVLPPEFEEGGKFDVSAGMECEFRGGEWVDGFHTRHGYVRGYCRKKRNR
jgi:hypothetical protein